jgi:hypothetical protein
MKPALYLAALTLIGLSSLHARSSASAPHLYDIRSGRVTYTINGSGQILGSQISTVGKERLIFDRYGTKSITETVEVKKQNILGQAKTDKTHTMVYLNGAIAYHVDFHRKRIMRTPNPAATASGMMGDEANLAETGRKLLKQMGGKQIGTDKVLGYTCEVWSLMGTQQCLYHGIPLRVVTNIMGLKSTKIATKAQFDIALKADAFKLPDFPIIDQMGESIPSDPARREALDAQESKKLLSKHQETASQIGNAIDAARRSGYDPASGAQPTPQQKNAMANAMLPMMKQQFLKEVTPMRHMRDCLRHADTRKEAIVCARKHNPNFDPADVPPRWDAATKRQTLQEMDQYLDTIVPCVRNAQTMQQVQACMPR